jgi:hypothetical protein
VSFPTVTNAEKPDPSETTCLCIHLGAESILPLLPEAFVVLASNNRRSRSSANHGGCRRVTILLQVKRRISPVSQGCEVADCHLLRPAQPSGSLVASHETHFDTNEFDRDCARLCSCLLNIPTFSSSQNTLATRTFARSFSPRQRLRRSSRTGRPATNIRLSKAVAAT